MHWLRDDFPIVPRVKRFLDGPAHAATKARKACSRRIRSGLRKGRRTTMSCKAFNLSPVAGGLGAEISGVDLATPLGEAAIAEIRQALLDHLVIFFHDQHLTPEQHLAFGRRFGYLNIHDFVDGTPDYPEIIEVRKEEHDTQNFGGAWHSDVTY